MIPAFPPHPEQYGAIDTYRIAAEWLDGHGTVHDWGCGQCFAQRFFERSEYAGIDGLFTDEKVDLAEWNMPCDSLLMRHVLENNPEHWREILKNALGAFRQRMALVTFTAFAGETHIYKTEQYETGPLSYLRFRKSDLTDMMGLLLVRDLPVYTTHPEHVFFLERKCK